MAVVSRVVKGLVAAAMAIAVTAMTVTLATSARAAPLAATTCPPYGPCEVITITITPNAVLPGATITITLSGNLFDVTFIIVLHSDPVTLGAVTTNAGGTGSGVFTIPAGTTPGSHVVTATDRADPSVTASAGLTVLAVTAPAAIAPSSAIPVTGADVARMIAAGAVAIGAGGLLVLSARRRRRKSWTSTGL